MADASPTQLGDEWVPADTFGARLALIRVERRWNITQAAKACGVDAESWRGWERGRSPQRVHEVARRIADASGANYVWLMTGGSLTRSRCVWPPTLSVVPSVPGQMALALEPAPELLLVGC